MCLSAFVGSQTKMALCEKGDQGPSLFPGVFQNLRLGVQEGAQGWVCGVGVASQVWQRLVPEEVGVALLRVERG